MGYELGAAYIGQIAAKKMIDEMLYGKPQPKKVSFIKRMMKKLAK
ncbi:MULTISPECIES: hypothetical protein [Vibrio]|jgi:hypothetical protein|uniref:Uncharacterized protein n=2 Tax=Vibrio TaxID=662 RepID=A0ABW7IQG6_9VIBR|nr:MULTISPECIES: hypothetical protein [Vibrio]EDL55656.1 hypothetical protein VSAK1_16697 [Vibrio mediterranei AK1]MCY9873072.1 hypothetical protein [Vibrio barjaei]PCD85875.1 hypothetical protein COR52_24130 [Vibrio mediterranei]PRQ68811.1 hypothetical protein COR51_05240 [Vibrio mediterranei]SBO08557.1 hypothetical protein VME0621_00649 [Vibrio mediterranei]